MDEFKHRYVLVPDVFVTQGPKGDKGDKGDPGIGSLPVSSDDVRYRGNVLTTILDELTYVPLTINFFTAPTTIYEKGQVLSNIQLSWSYNKSIEAQSITGAQVVTPTLTLSDRTKVVTLSSVSANTSIVLTVDDLLSDSIPAKTAQVDLTFLNRVYFGKRTLATIDSAFILGLSSELRNDRDKSFSVSTGVGEYIWFASPVAYGAASFKANGFDGGFDLITTLNFTNAFGHTENYYIYRSTYDNLGNTNITVL